MEKRKRSHDTTTSAPSKAASENTASQAAATRAPLGRAEIEARASSADSAGERRHWQVIGMLADSVPQVRIVAATGCRPRTIRQIAQRYRERGPAGLVDGRQRSRGAAPILAADQCEALRRALRQSAPDGGRWTGPKVAQWIAERTGKCVHRQRGWEYLRRLADSEDQERNDQWAALPIGGSR